MSLLPGNLICERFLVVQLVSDFRLNRVVSLLSGTEIETLELCPAPFVWKYFKPPSIVSFHILISSSLSANRAYPSIGGHGH